MSFIANNLTTDIKPSSLVTQNLEPVNYQIKACDADFKVDDNILKVCEMLKNCNLLPDALRSTKDHDKTADLFMVISLGKTLGLSPYQSVYGIYCLPGSLPSLYTKTKRAIALKAGFRIEDRYDEKEFKAYCTVWRGNVPYTASYSLQDALDARKMIINPNTNRPEGVLNKSGRPSPWSTHPRQMMSTRAQSRALDLACADLFLGFESKEQQDDYIDLDLNLDNNIYTSEAKNEAKRPTKKAKKAKVLDLGDKPNLEACVVQDPILEQMQQADETHEQVMNEITEFDSVY